MNKKESSKTATSNGIQMSSEEQIGFHKGALSTLAKERQELLKMVSVVEQLMQLHLKGLQELGVDLSKMASEAQQQGQQGTQAPGQQATGKKPGKKIEDILK